MQKNISEVDVKNIIFNGDMTK